MAHSVQANTARTYMHTITQLWAVGRISPVALVAFNLSIDWVCAQLLDSCSFGDRHLSLTRLDTDTCSSPLEFGGEVELGREGERAYHSGARP